MENSPLDKKPDSQEKNESIETPELLINNIEEASKNTRSIYLIYIGFLFYCALTVVSTTDRQLILNNEKINLPIIGVQIPVTGFFFVAPLAALILFSYFQLYLHHLKTLLDKLKNTYSDFNAKHIYPWIINIGNNPIPGPVGMLQKTVVNIVLWWLLPLILMLFPMWYIRRHEPVFTYLVILFQFISIGLSYWFWINYEKVKMPPGLMKKLIFAWQNSGIVLLIAANTVFVFVYIFIMCPLAFSGKAKNFPFLSNLLYVDLSYQKLIEEPLQDYKNLYWLDLSGIQLQGANLTEAILKKVDFRNASLRHTNLTRAMLTECRFNNSQCQGANFKTAKLSGASFTSAQLDGASFTSAQLDGANFTSAQLDGASFTSAQLDGADFFNAQLHNANFKDAKLNYSIFFNAVLDCTAFNNTLLANANFSWAQLAEANFRNAKLDSSDFRGAKLDNADFSFAQLNNTDFNGVKLVGVTFYRSKLNGTKFKDAEIDRCDFRGTQLEGVEFNRTILRGVKFGLYNSDKKESDTTIQGKLKQLSKVKTLYGVKGLEQKLENTLRKQYQHLFVEPK